MAYNNYFQYHYPKNKKTKKHKINNNTNIYSKIVKLLTLVIFVIFIISLIIIKAISNQNYPIYNIKTNLSNADLLNYYDNNNQVIDLNNYEEDLNINESGIYNLTGTFNHNININIPSDEKIYLNLNDVTLNSSIVCNSGKHLYISCDGINNITSSNLSTDNIDASIYSKCDLSITGEGSLNIISNLNGIKASDDLTIYNVALNLNTKKHGINVNDGLEIYQSEIIITSVCDGIHSGNILSTNKDKTYVTLKEVDLTINAGGDAVESTGVIGIVSGNYNINTDLNTSNMMASKDGLKSDTCVKIIGGTIKLSTYEKGINTSMFEINGGYIEIDSDDDSIHVSNYLVVDGGELSITSSDDALHSDNDIYINSGNIVVNSCYEGLEGINIYINGGTTKINSSDDGVNVSCNPNENMGMGGFGMGGSSSDKPNNGKLKVTGGVLYVSAKGDGLDSNDEIIVTGGLVLVDGPTDSGNGALDYDTTCKITGGTLIAVGSSGMAQSATSGECGGLYSVSGQANQTFMITDSKGNLILAYTPSKTYQTIAISSNLLKKNKEYNIYLGSVVTGDDIFGFITSGTIESTGTLKQSFTASNTFSSNSGNIGGMGGGNNPGGMGGGNNPGGMGGGGRR